MAEKGTDLCRVRGEGGIFLGFRKDILTENLTDRDNTLLSCTRCQGILREVCISSSGEQFCSCCTKGEEQTHSNIHVRNTVLSLKCSCPLYQRGCEWLGTLGECENHLDVCGHVHETCKLGCKIVLPRHEHKIHVSEMCLFREIPCEHCMIDFKVCDMPNHLSKCDKMPLTCELECGMLVCREDVSRHLEEECVEKKVECPFIKYKCEVGLLKRKELNQHLEEKRTEHTELKLSAMEEIIINQSETIDKQGNLFQQMSIQTELNHSKMEEIVMKQSERIDKQNKQTDSLEAKVKQLTQNFEVLETEAVNLRETLYYLTNVTKLYWRINAIQNNVLVFRSEESCHAGDYHFNFELHFSSGNIQIVMNVCPRSNLWLTHGLKLPYKVGFITRLICHSNLKATKEYRSELIEIKDGTIREYPRKIATIPTSDITLEFMKDECIELEIFIKILK